MKQAQKESLLAELKQAQETFDQEVFQICERLRDEVIIPVCRKHKLTFLSGMGTFFFSKGKQTYSGGYGITDARWGSKLIAELTPIFELLNTEVTHNQVLGYYVSDVSKDDYT